MTRFKRLGSMSIQRRLLVMLLLALCCLPFAPAFANQATAEEAADLPAEEGPAESSPIEAEGSPIEAEGSLDERLDALLAETLTVEEYRETKRCLSRHSFRSVDILNQEYLLFRKNGQYWLNKLRHRCVTLRRDLVLTFNPRGTSSSCSGDLVYVTDRFDLERGFTASGRPVSSHGTCLLGEFESITKEQASLLRELR